MLKYIKYNNKVSLKNLENILGKRKASQINKTSAVKTIINNVRKKGDTAILNYEKKFSKVKIKSNKILFSKKK